MQFHLGNENTGGNEVKDEAAMPKVEPENLAAPQHHSLAQIMGCHKSNIPTQEEFNGKSAACKQQATHMTKLLLLLACICSHNTWWWLHTDLTTSRQRHQLFMMECPKTRLLEDK